MEHALHPEILLVAKALVFLDERAEIDRQSLDRLTADAILRRSCLSDPQQLRPLPLSGIAGWRPVRQDEMFYRQTPCFRPLRPGRGYPAPMPAGESAVDQAAPLVAEARR
jgi:hypothetical protein